MRDTVDLTCPYCGRVADARKEPILTVSPTRYAHRRCWIERFEVALGWRVDTRDATLG